MTMIWDNSLYDGVGNKLDKIYSCAYMIKEFRLLRPII